MNNNIVCSSLSGGVGEKLDSFFQKKNGFVEVNPGNVIMPKKYQDICHEILDSHVRSDDVWMISYPRTGNKQFKITIFQLKKGNQFITFDCVPSTNARQLKIFITFSIEISCFWSMYIE